MLKLGEPLMRDTLGVAAKRNENVGKTHNSANSHTNLQHGENLVHIAEKLSSSHAATGGRQICDP